MADESPIEIQLEQIRWLDAFRETPTITYACRKTGIPRAKIREWQADPEFAQSMTDIQEEMDDLLEEHMLNIAMGKIKRPVLDKATGKQLTVSSEDGTLVTPAWEIIRSDAITLAVARARMPEKYADAMKFDFSNLPQEKVIAMAKAAGRIK